MTAPVRAGALLALALSMSACAGQSGQNGQSGQSGSTTPGRPQATGSSIRQLTAPAAVVRRYHGQSVTGLYQVCVEPLGAVTSVDVEQPIPYADAEVTAALRSTRFPERSHPECSRVVLTFAVPHLDSAQYRELPPDESPAPRRLPVAADEPQLAPEVRQHYAGRHVSGEARLYVEPDGEVARVESLQPISGCEDYVRERLLAEHQRNDRHERVRYRQTIDLDFPGTPTDGPPISFAAAVAKTVPTFVLHGWALTNPAPHLPDLVKIRNKARELVGVYAVTVATDGSVERVDVVGSIPGADASIIETLRGWKFKPQPLRIRSLVRFVFTIS